MQGQDPEPRAGGQDRSQAVSGSSSEAGSIPGGDRSPRPPSPALRLHFLPAPGHCSSTAGPPPARRVWAAWPSSHWRLWSGAMGWACTPPPSQTPGCHERQLTPSCHECGHPVLRWLMYRNKCGHSSSFGVAPGRYFWRACSCGWGGVCRTVQRLRLGIAPDGAPCHPRMPATATALAASAVPAPLSRGGQPAPGVCSGLGWAGLSC